MLEIAVSPSGRLVIETGSAPNSVSGSSLSESSVSGSSLSGSSLSKASLNIVSAFEKGPGAGIFSLAARKGDVDQGASVAFWREIASLYMHRLCRTPEGVEGAPEPIAPPSPAELAALLRSVPPAPGAEYIDSELILRLWSELDDWVRSEVVAAGGSLTDWIKKNAPVWHQVGRVCFHLAENKRDPDFPFAFLATYAPKVSKAGKIQYQPLRNALVEYAGAGNKKALVNLLAPVHRAARQSKLVEQLAGSNEIFQALRWTPEEAYSFLKEVPVLEESGVIVRLPDWWHRRPRPRVAVTIGDSRKTFVGADSLLDFRVDLVLEGESLTVKEIEHLLSQGEGLVSLKGRWLEVDRDKLTEALEHWKRLEKVAGSDGISFIEGMRMLAGASEGLYRGQGSGIDRDLDWSFVNAGTWLGELLEGLRYPDRLVKAKLSKEFRATLRPYQKTGHDWLWFLSSLGLGACLADDMGLGKTVQVLSVLSSIKEQDSGRAGRAPSLLVLPASLLSNWRAELERFAPTLSARYAHSSESSPEELAAMAADPQGSLTGVDVVMTTYGMLVRQQWLLERSWRLVILDEAQAIKNPGSQQTRAVKKLKGEARIALTGTPVENRLSDLWSLFDFLCPGLLGSSARFKSFVKSLEEREHNRYSPLRNLVSPYILRRLKSDRSIIADLPDKTEVKVHCGLAREQAALYERSVEEFGRALKEVEGIERRGLVLAYLMRFKQICNHPAQLSGDGDFAAARSGKFGRLAAICDEIASRREKVLVFTQFREITEALSEHLAGVFGRPGLVLHGGTAVKKRKGLVDAFQSVGGPPFVVLSLKAGGTGLNLTAASHVVHFDRWWNPAVENQATDRAYRIGQHRNVLVHKFVCLGTIEEKIDALIDEKSALADSILTGGAESLLTEMSDNELMDIIRLDLDRVRVGEDR
ncbi:MAG: DEAD/DEAH box helicase [Candidatus Obscuribacterales bacterium]